MTVAPAVPAATSLVDLIRAGEWRRAVATVRLQDGSAELIDTLMTVQAIQEDIRARRYSVARSCVHTYQSTVDTLTGEAGAELRLYVHPDALLDALNALDGAQRETDPAALEARLAGALAEPLTRAEALNSQGVLQALLGQEEQARAFLEAARTADPGHYRALTNLGNLDMEAGRYAQAEAIYREVIAMAPDYAGGHHNLGVAVRRQGRVAEGVGHIRRGQRLTMSRSREETRAEAKEQFARTPALKYLRVVLIAAMLLIVFMALRGPGG